MSNHWKETIIELSDTLGELSILDISGNELLQDEALEKWKKIALKIRDSDNTVFFIGNGASASMASHFSADLRKNAGIRTYVFTDISLITAYANDLSYEDVFAAPLRTSIREGDMVVAISSSGESVNVLKAVKEAKNKRGIVITLSAMKYDNSLRKMGHLNFYVPANTYGMAETSHAALLHYWTDMLTEI